MTLPHAMHRRTAVVISALIALLAPPASAERLEFNATLSIESIETLFPPAPGQNSGPFFNTVPPGHGYANVTPAGGITALLGVTGLTGTVRVGDLGTDAIFNFWELEIDGIGSPSFAGAPLKGPMPLFVGDVRNLSLMANQTAPIFATQNGTIGPGLGGVFISTSPGTPGTGPPTGPFTFRAEYGTWTTGMLTLPNLVHPTFGATSPMATGFDQRTAGGLGMLQMVTPMSHETTGRFFLPLPSGYRGGAFAVLGLEFIPEPARFVLLTSGALFLCALGQSRRRASGK